MLARLQAHHRMPTARSPVSGDVPFDHFVREFSRRVAVASRDFPTTRCLSLARLSDLCTDVAAELGRRRILIPLSVRACRKRLQAMGLLRPVPLEHPEGVRNPIRLYLVGLSSRRVTAIDPREMLQAAVPSGVICYFTALQHHELTTQSPTQQHIAQLTEYPPRTTGSRPRRGERGKGARRAPREWNPLGTHLFDHEGIPYYRTNRDSAMVTSHGSHQIHPRAIIRVTSLEQSLVDTLHKPLSCGGPAVVLESWDTGLRELEQRKLAFCLRKVDRHVLARRVGCMLEKLGHRPGRALSAVLSRAANAIDRNDPSEPAPFLPGVPSTDVDQRWFLQVP